MRVYEVCGVHRFHKWVVVQILVPFLGTLYIRCRIIIGIQKGTIILTTTQIGHCNIDHMYISTCICVRTYIHTYIQTNLFYGPSSRGSETPPGSLETLGTETVNIGIGILNPTPLRSFHEKSCSFGPQGWGFPGPSNVVPFLGFWYGFLVRTLIWITKKVLHWGVWVGLRVSGSGFRVLEFRVWG